MYLQKPRPIVRQNKESFIHLFKKKTYFIRYNLYRIGAMMMTQKPNTLVNSSLQLLHMIHLITSHLYTQKPNNNGQIKYYVCITIPAFRSVGLSYTTIHYAGIINYYTCSCASFKKNHKNAQELLLGTIKFNYFKNVNGPTRLTNEILRPLHKQHHAKIIRSHVYYFGNLVIKHIFI